LIVVEGGDSSRNSMSWSTTFVTSCDIIDTSTSCASKTLDWA